MSVTPTIPPPVAPPAPPPPPRSNWTPGRVISLVAGSLLAIMALGLIAAGGVATWLTNTQRDAAGYVTSDRHLVSTAGYAITTDRVQLGTAADLVTPADVLGTIRITATATNSTTPVFIGVAPSDVVDRYLRGVSRQVITDWTPFGSSYRESAGTAPQVPPTQADIWTAQVSGPGAQSLTWEPATGNWTAVVMKANGHAGVSVVTSVGATVPDLAWYAAGFFAFGAVLLMGATLLIVIPVVRAGR